MEFAGTVIMSDSKGLKPRLSASGMAPLSSMKGRMVLNITVITLRRRSGLVEPQTPTISDQTSSTTLADHCS